MQGLSLAVADEGYSLVVVLGLLIATPSLVAVHRLWGTWASVLSALRLGSFRSRALEVRFGSCGPQT